jgi:hypothetical protein
MTTTPRIVQVSVALLTAACVLGISLFAVGQLLQSKWIDLFLFNGDSLTLALYAQSLFSGEPRDWTFSSQIFFFPEIVLYLICYALTPTLEWSFILNACVNFWLYAFLLYKIAKSVGASIFLRSGFVLLASCVLLLYIALEQHAEVNVTALVTLFLFNTYYFGAVLCSLLVAWMSCRVLAEPRQDKRFVYGLIAICSAATYFSNPMFLLQGAIPFALTLAVMHWLRASEKRVLYGLMIAVLAGVAGGQLLRMVLSDHVGKSVGKYVHLRSFIDGLQGVGNNFAKVSQTSAGVVEYSIIICLLIASIVIALRCVWVVRLSSRQSDGSASQATQSSLLFLVLFAASSACITIVGTIVSGNFLMRYFLPVALFPLFAIVCFPLCAGIFYGKWSRVYFAACALVGFAACGFALRASPPMSNFSWIFTSPFSETHSGIRCFNDLMAKHRFNAVGTFWTARTLDAYGDSGARVLQANERFEPTLWLNNRATYKHLQVNGVIVSHAIDNVRHKGNIYPESTHVLGKPDKVYPCKDFDIYFYEDGSGGFRYLAEQMKKLKR